MLEKLDDIDWSKLRTSYGRSATDVPKSIRRLLSGSPAERQKGWRKLSSDLCDSDVVDTATLVAIPFLLELLQSSETQDKFYIIWILHDSSQSIEATSDELRRKPNRKIEVEVGLAIAEALEIYISLLQHPEWRVRGTSINFIIKGAFQKTERTRIYNVYQRFKKVEKHPKITQHFENWDSYIKESKLLDNMDEETHDSGDTDVIVSSE